MPTVGIRDLSRNASKVIDEVQRSGRPFIVTRNGEPVVGLYAIDPEKLEDFVLAHAPDFTAARAEADEALARGDVEYLEDVLSELGP